MTATTAVTEGLVRDLAQAWDGFDALTAIIAARGGSGGGAPVLHRLLEAACAGRPELRAAVWNAETQPPQLVAQLGGAVIDSAVRAMAEAAARDGRTRIANPRADLGTVPLSRVEGIASRGEAAGGSRAVVALWSPAGAAPLDGALVRIAEALAIQVALVFDEDAWTKRLLHQERLDADLDAARRIQTALLEIPRSGESDFFSWASFSRPARVVGGDFHDLGPAGDGGVGMVIGDVMGKGLPAALLGAACVAHVLRAVTVSIASGDERPSRILTFANQTLSPELIRLDTFASVAILRLDPNPMRLRLADAGHGNVLLRRASGDVVTLRGVETFLGVEKDAFSEQEIPIAPGDAVLIYTDGVTDVARRHRRSFDVASWFAGQPALGPRELLGRLEEELSRWCGPGEAPEDDITCIAVQVRAS